MTYPLPTSQELLEFYESGFYIKTITKSAIDKRLSLGELRALAQFEFIRQFLPENGNLGKALEIGCSDGSLLLLLEQYGFDVWGYEPDMKMAELANQRISKTQRKIKHDMFPGEELEQNTYHFIGSSHVFEHIADPVTHLEQIRISLVKDGILFMEVPNEYRRLKDFLCPGARKLGHLYYYSPKSIEKLLKNNGFEIVNLATCGKNVNHVKKLYGKSSKEIKIDKLLEPIKERVFSNVFLDKLSKKVTKKIENLRRKLLESDSKNKKSFHYTNYWHGNQQGQWIRIIAKKIL
ncbi:MAG: class I SAM-dependent methyltransferase [Crocosphaera sp.]|nr:class I SAM-dependent methyltransferase [Crocosphaera sp.]